MTLSCQDNSPTSGRTNQKERTRTALIDAASRLLRDGRPPSIPEAAALALVSVATAYRYFRTAEDLWEEAALFDSTLLIDPEAVEAAIEAAGDDVEARLDVVVRQLGWAFIDHEPVSRQIMKTSLDRWFTSQTESLDARPVRPGIRNQWNALVVRPLRGTLRDDRLDEVVDALGLVLGTETVLTLVDVLHLSPEAAKDRLLITARWILRSGLAEAARP